jgi:serine/threonine-protein kinase
MTAVERSIALEPTPQAWSNYGTILYALGRFPDAAKAFERAAAMGPGNGTVWVNLGDALRQSGNGAGAAEAYRKAAGAAGLETGVNPGDDTAQLVLALAYGRLGEAARSKACLDRALQLSPGNPETLFQAAILEAAWGHREAALAFLEKSVAAGKNPVTIATEPDLAPLKDDPRVRALTARAHPKGEGR